MDILIGLFRLLLLVSFPTFLILFHNGYLFNDKYRRIKTAISIFAFIFMLISIQMILNQLLFFLPNDSYLDSDNEWTSIRENTAFMISIMVSVYVTHIFSKQYKQLKDRHYERIKLGQEIFEKEKEIDYLKMRNSKLEQKNIDNIFPRLNQLAYVDTIKKDNLLTYKLVFPETSSKVKIHSEYSINSDEDILVKISRECLKNRRIFVGRNKNLSQFHLMKEEESQ